MLLHDKTVADDDGIGPVRVLRSVVPATSSSLQAIMREGQRLWFRADSLHTKARPLSSVM